MAAVRKSVRSAPSPRLVGLWIALLGLAQVADLVTTQVDMSKGGLEANELVVAMIRFGGLGLVWFVKLALVAAMAASALVVRHYWPRQHRQAAMAQAVIWRCTQACVLVLALTALHNVQVLSEISS